MKLTIPDPSLVVLIGASGSGKSTFARRHFRPTEILSSDTCRGLVSDDENNQAATTDAFEVLHFIAAKRLAAGRLTVIDATNVQTESRQTLLNLTRQYHYRSVAIVFDLPERVCQERNRHRPDRDFGPHVIRRQREQLRRGLYNLRREGFSQVIELQAVSEVESVEIERQPLWTNRTHETGPFDIIGDIHGCWDELVVLFGLLGYTMTTTTGADGAPVYHVQPPQGRKAIFLGDLVDRGPQTPTVLRLVMGMIEAGTALCVPGNHDVKLVRALRGAKVQISYGLAQSLAQLDNEPPAFKEQVVHFLDGLVSHYVLDGGQLVVAHSGMKEDMQGRASKAVREFALYGETTGETDEFGLPVRYAWATDYRGKAMVVYGHTPIPQPEWLNRTVNIDTGCVFGGSLTALRYPELEFVSVPAKHTYAEPARPFLAPTEAAPLTAQQQLDDVLDLDDVLGKRLIQTRLNGNITIREENALAALEVMSRFAVNPKWLIYLPPTMSPTKTSHASGWLERPTEVFAYYRHVGVPHVVCQEKHMGSRAVIVVCRDEEAARQRFGVIGETGMCYTRTGRRFFDDLVLETELLVRLQTAFAQTGLWDEFKTDWFMLDCELMPWSAKAQGLIHAQYAPVGVASRTALSQTVVWLEQAGDRGLSMDDFLNRHRARVEMVDSYVRAYRNYCWPTPTITDLKLAPFHVLASAGAVHLNKTHEWHMETLARLCAADESLLQPTGYRVVDVTDPASETAATGWWETLTEAGGEGMVVKPLNPIVRDRRGLVQPAIKCRGRDYLRIIYGPEYTAPENLERLRQRGLGAKRSLAIREFALGVEALERFTRGEPLRRVHECVFGVLALESEPVDPRL